MEKMFIGEFVHNIDQKGRLAVPVKFRNKLAGGGTITRGLDNCLIIYPREEWEKLAKKLAELPLSQANARAFVRLMLAGAMEIDLDKNGRFVLPSYLRKYAQIKNTAVVAGLYDRIEIWDEKIWEDYKSKAETESGEIAEKLSELGV